MNLDEFQVLRTQSGREENYSSMKHVKRIVYHCIRSNCRGTYDFDINIVVISFKLILGYES